MRVVRRAPAGVLVLVWVLLATVGTSSTVALLSGPANSSVHTLGGAVFSPLSIAAPNASLVNGAPRLTWSPVTLTSGAPVSYTVTRTASGGSTATACPPASLSIVGGMLRCDDTGATGGAIYSYTVQPYLERGGSVTWTRPVSAASSQVSVPRLSFGGVGPVALFTGNSPTVVNYPVGTQSGDVLVFIARNGRNKDISLPTGWSTLVATTRGNPASGFLVAWRLADSASSTTVSINSSNDGAVAWIVRYRRTAGITAAPVLAHAAVVSGQSASATASFSTTGSLTTTQPWATVIGIATTITAQVPALPTGSPYGAQVGVSATSSGTTFSLSVADRLVTGSGTATASPGWQASAATNTWEVVTIAFA